MWWSSDSGLNWPNEDSSGLHTERLGSKLLRCATIYIQGFDAVTFKESLLYMTENNETKTASKLEIDKPQDFRFHVAYNVYSEAWDQNPADTIRLKLNELISSLSNDRNYPDFYSKISEYRKDSGSFRSGRMRIETKRKRDWQRTDAQDKRNRRYR